ncbi:hypothetical protein PENSPDRAFT_580710 [Peniophora sp. CONT]|nr:hypothetical protein PENSPDRAFT_580710 [Peniophora sp. CONT]
MVRRATKASARDASSSAVTKSHIPDAIRFKGHGKLRGTIAKLEDGEELEVDAKLLAHYLYFLYERNNVSIRRFAGDPRPWTKDEILHSYRFADDFRIYDRVSQYTITHVISEGDQSLEECCFRAILFRTFARISTWEYLCETFGIPTWNNFDRARYVQALDHRLASGESIYTSAYQTSAPTPGQIGGHSMHDRHLRMIDLMMRTSLPQRLLELPEICDQYYYVQLYPSMGPFLALRIVLDINMIEPLMRPPDWAVPGPGAKAGAALITGLNLGEKDCIQVFQWLQREGNHLFLKAGYRESDIPAITPGDPGLTAIDHEHSLCEFSKYVRIDAGDYGKGSSKYKYTNPNPEPVTRQLPQGWKSFAEACAQRDVSYTKPEPAFGDAEEEEAEWYISHIVTKKNNRGDAEPEYLVRWTGYPPSEDTWQPESSLREDSYDVLEEYEAKLRNIKDTQARIRRGSL